jgi:hypothetical protein
MAKPPEIDVKYVSDKNRSAAFSCQRQNQLLLCSDGSDIAAKKGRARGILQPELLDGRKILLESAVTH